MVRFRTATASLLLAALVLLSACSRGTSTPDPVGSDAVTAADPPPASGTPYTIDKEKSTASYKVGEKFAEIELPATAVGTTSGFAGDLMLGDDGALLPALIKVDMTQLRSDKERRDAIVQKTLKVERYPYAEFVIGEQSQAVPVPPDGTEVAFMLAGTMKLANVKQPVVWNAKARREGDTLVLTATAKVKMLDFNIQPPTMLGFVTVNNDVDLEVNLTAQKK